MDEEIFFFLNTWVATNTSCISYCAHKNVFNNSYIKSWLSNIIPPSSSRLHNFPQDSEFLSLFRNYFFFLFLSFSHSFSVKWYYILLTSLLFTFPAQSSCLFISLSLYIRCFLSFHCFLFFLRDSRHNHIVVFYPWIHTKNSTIIPY